MLALCAAICYTFSIPVLDALTWQATILDKLSAAFTILGLHIFLSIARMPFGRRRLILGNIALFCVVLFAYNSKEAAWILFPIGFLIVIAPPGTTIKDCFSWTVWRHAVLSLIVPGTYAVFQVVKKVVNLSDLSDLHRNHIIGGDVLNNFRRFFLMTFNISPSIPSAWPHVIIVLLGLVALCGIGFAIWRRTPFLIIPLLGCLGSYLIPAQTLYGSPFYLLVPNLFLWWFMMSVVIELTSGLRAYSFGKITSSMIMIVLVIFCIGNLMSSRSTLNFYKEKVTHSKNFISSLPNVADAHPLSSSSKLVLLYPSTASHAFMFLGKQWHRDLAPFVFPGEVNLKLLKDWDSRVQEFPYEENGTWPELPENATVIVYDGVLSVKEIRKL